MIVGLVSETYPDERRVALVPTEVKTLVGLGLEVQIEPGAGVESGYPDAAYVEAGGTVGGDRAGILSAATVLCRVRAPGAAGDRDSADVSALDGSKTVIAQCDALDDLPTLEGLASSGASVLALELMPRITRAQSMDVLSSQATVAGYKAVLLAASRVPRFFPMLTTAAGTISPARVFVIGAGVAGLQAIATARRLGAVVSAYDVRPVVKEQVESLGATFVHMDLDTEEAEGAGGYAKAMDEAFYARQREFMAEVIQKNDVVITTAAIPGRKAPVLLNADMIKAMPPGSVIVDLAAERGGNCEPTEAGVEVQVQGTTILGPINLPSTVPLHASSMFSRNVVTFLKHLLDDDGNLELDRSDEITDGTLVCYEGTIVHGRVREVHGLEPLEPVAVAEPESEDADDDEGDADA